MQIVESVKSSSQNPPGIPGTIRGGRARPAGKSQEPQPSDALSKLYVM